MRKIVFTVLVLFFWNPIGGSAQSIANTVHNLSTSGPGSIIASSESRICIFCHTPHKSKPNSPLWNRNDPGLTYSLYNSSTLNALPEQPDGSSIMCLSCHDGTIALGNTYSEVEDIDFTSVTTMPPGRSNLSTDLRDDHPISFVYDNRLAITDEQLIQPSAIIPPVSIEASKVQCTSCHDPHKNIYNDFLVASNQFSAICTSCHDRTSWTSSSHNSSASTWNGTQPNPWPNSSYTTVAENACASCHWTHNARGIPRLLKYQQEENNCLDCHNGNVATTNIQTQLAKTYVHNVYGYTDTHDPSESGTILNKHVECVDCHNPHASNNIKASAPNVKGSLTGVKGIDQNGNLVDPALYEYEICYRCHAASITKPLSSTSRLIEQNNVRLEFDLSNPSYHPVAGPGANQNVPSLIPPMTTSSIIYCTECHSSDGSNSPAGPHGSTYPQIMKYNYSTADYTIESYMSYELCYKCHDRTAIISKSPNNFQDKVHNKHIVKENTPCNACHDPHGISNTQGSFVNQTHLINFDLSIVSPNANGKLYFQDNGSFAGECNLSCHGKNHSSKQY